MIKNPLEFCRRNGDEVCLTPCIACMVKADEANKANAASAEPQPVQPDIYRPSYYNDGKIKLSDFIKDKGFGFFDGLAIKYITRAGKRPGVDPVSDYKKAIESLQFKIEQIEDQRGSK